MISKLNYDEVISQLLQVMITSQQRIFTSQQMGKTIRKLNPNISDSQALTALRKLKEHSSIAVTKVNRHKSYISYRGIV